MSAMTTFGVTCRRHTGWLQSGHFMSVFCARKQPSMHSLQKVCWHGSE